MFVRWPRSVAGVLAFVGLLAWAPPSGSLPSPPARSFITDTVGNPVFLGYKQEQPSRTQSESGIVQCDTAPTSYDDPQRGCVGGIDVVWDPDSFDESDPATEARPWKATPFRVWYRRTWGTKTTVGQPGGTVPETALVTRQRDLRMAYSEEGRFWTRDASGKPVRAPLGTTKRNDGPGVCPWEGPNPGTNPQPRENLCRAGTLFFSGGAEGTNGVVPDVEESRSGALAVVYDSEKRLTSLDGTKARFQIWYHPDFDVRPSNFIGGVRTFDTCGIGCEQVSDIRTAWSNNGLDWFNDMAVRQPASDPARLVTGNVRNATPDLNAESLGPADILYFPSGDGPASTPSRRVNFAMYYVATHERASDPIRESVFLGVSENGHTFERIDPAGCGLPRGCPVFQGAHASGQPDAWDADHVGFGSLVCADAMSRPVGCGSAARDPEAGYAFFYSGGKGPEDVPGAGNEGKGPNGPVHGPWEGTGLAVAGKDGANFVRVTGFQSDLRPDADENWRKGSTWSPNVVDVGGQLTMYLLGSLHQNPFISPNDRTAGPVTGSSMGLFISGVIKQVLLRPELSAGTLFPGGYVNRQMVQEGFPIAWSAPHPLTTRVDLEIVIDGQPESALCKFTNQSPAGSLAPVAVKACVDVYPDDGTGGILLTAWGSDEETVPSRTRIVRFVKDTQVEPPEVRFRNDRDANGVLEGSERSGDLVLEGLAEPGAAVDPRLEQDSGPAIDPPPVTADTDGKWERSFSPDEYASLSAGVLRALAAQVDRAGNQSTCCSMAEVRIPEGIVSPPDVRFVGQGSADEDGLISPVDGDLTRLVVRATANGEGALSLVVQDGGDGVAVGRTATGEAAVDAAAGSVVDFEVDVTDLAEGPITAVARQVPEQGDFVEGFSTLTFDPTPPHTTVSSAACPSAPGGTCYSLPPVLTAGQGLGLFGPYQPVPLPGPPPSPAPSSVGVSGDLQAVPRTAGPFEASTVVVRGRTQDATTPLQFVYVLAVNEATGEQRGAIAYRDSRDFSDPLAKDTTWAAYFGKQRPNLAPNEQGSGPLTPGSWIITAYAMDFAGNLEARAAENTRRLTILPAA